MMVLVCQDEPIDASIDRAVRLVRMIQLLQRQSWRARELAEYFGVSHRTVNRDILDLQSWPLRVPLIEEGGRWQVFKDGGWRWPEGCVS
jgi:predicted DNA-binding transcriptional regulator YafY